ncbi:uncharacterized protein ASPGLDRAFT_51110 [Aspergillus glaucus CBS 516.65]|uniref:Calcineurin-like phosphoesterase domain-containing protein n=1 Tax=Aspergillus glaucus CBS 516.65 TaxID=1160497 RepID=A0A1L9V9R9_ASPGL|nr:hypothetical protein ASPGLDRAFT_51110 [Aspergillus glaucus CBS 516.65]OJJ80696.1 hypothetical protein ASPGLDRAFT_51110 [Aspergillus glaucus CBS 516.65]
MALQKLRTFFSGKQTLPFHVLSDLHLEVDQQYVSFPFPVCANHLILAGDVGRLADYDAYLYFLQKQVERFATVFLVLGNHEFYKESFKSGIEKARRLEKEPCLNGQLVLLHQRRYDVPDSNVTILGCTLWSRVSKRSSDDIRQNVQDFHQIEDWTIDDHNAAYDADFEWLLRELKSMQNENQRAGKDQKRSVLVVTHHAPLTQLTSSPRNENSSISPAFATDILSDIPKLDGVKAWLFGHTHYSTEFKYRGVKVVSNQRGYVLNGIRLGDKTNRFNPTKVIHL